jgi:hypothetical protein
MEFDFVRFVQPIFPNAALAAWAAAFTGLMSNLVGRVRALHR